jgi:HEPN domain-containing protein
MHVDFASAATRHRSDANLLLKERRPDNAAYLSGYVVECALKAVVARSGVPAGPYGHKLLQLATDGLDLAIMISPLSSRFRPPLKSVKQVRTQWTEQQRYVRTGVWEDARAEALLAAADEVWRSCVGAMFLDGFIPEPR